MDLMSYFLSSRVRSVGKRVGTGGDCAVGLDQGFDVVGVAVEEAELGGELAQGRKGLLALGFESG